MSSLFAMVPALARSWFELAALVHLIAVVSLVYSGTRREAMREILYGALRSGLWISGFFVLFFVVFYLVAAWL
ncbi:MAG: hypothetical protein K6T86_18320 [Pirellulales bacterium]|nr:hypothetical protein [Pirellulales bacterium]